MKKYVPTAQWNCPYRQIDWLFRFVVIQWVWGDYMNKTSYYKHSIFNIIFSLFYILPFGFLPLYDYFVSIGKPIADSIFDIFSSVLFLLFFVGTPIIIIINTISLCYNVGVCIKGKEHKIQCIILTVINLLLTLFIVLVAYLFADRAW